MRQAVFAGLHCGGGDGAARRSRPATADLPASTTLDRVDREVWGGWRPPAPAAARAGTATLAGHRRPNPDRSSVAAIPPRITPGRPARWVLVSGTGPGRGSVIMANIRGAVGLPPLLAAPFRKPWIRERGGIQHRHATPTSLVPERRSTACAR
jgi:hypothetical protein